MTRGFEYDDHEWRASWPGLARVSEAAEASSYLLLDVRSKLENITMGEAPSMTLAMIGGTLNYLRPKSEESQLDTIVSECCFVDPGSI